MRGLNISSLASSAGVLALYQALNKTITGIVSFGKSSLQAYAGFESMQKGLETFFQSSEKGKAVFEDLRKLSNETTFGVDELANSATQLLNVGTQASKLNQTLTMLGNVAQGDKQKFAELTSVFAKIQSTGKAGSMQLQQLAMRGLPIYDILKKIGVQGTASASDIEKAFEEMTKEGGQFYNAMNNINDTIEGKQGFISDYFREFKVNFAEVSGLSDIYKISLDGIKEAIGNVSDFLLKINENPVYKAIFKGVLFASITALIGIISIGLIGAIIKLNQKLLVTAMLKGLINPTGIGLAIAGIVGLTVAMASYSKSLDEAQEKKDKFFGDTNTGDFSTKAQKDLQDATSILDEYKSKFEETLKKIKEQEESIKNGPNRYVNIYTSEELKRENEKLELLKSQSEQWESLINSQNEYVNNLQKSVDIEGKLKTMTQEVEDIYANTSIGKQKEDLKEVESQLKKMQTILQGKLIKQELLPKVDQIIKELENKQIELKVKIALQNAEEWQKELQKILGLSNEEVFDNDTNSIKDGESQVNTYLQKWDDLIKNGFSGLENLDLLSSNSKVLENLANSGLFKIGDKSSQRLLKNSYGIINDILNQKDVSGNSIISKNLNRKDLVTENQRESIETSFEEFEKLKKHFGEFDPLISLLSDKFEDLGFSVDDIKGKIIPLRENLSKYAKEKFLGQSGDFQAAAEGFTNGGIWGAIIQSVINALANVCQGMEGFEEVMNPITTLFENLSVIIESVMKTIKSALTLIQAFAKIINTVLKFFKPLIDLIDFGIGKFMDGLLWLAEQFESLLAWLFPWIEEETKEDEENQKELRQAYEDLLSAMKDAEEYYDKRKHQVLGEQFKTDAKSVNDMILTPQGNFSTNPNDYIIATKNPSSLNASGKSNVIMNVKINNLVSDKVNATATQRTDENGITSLIVNISRKIANDFMSGDNGWESAVAVRENMNKGRSVCV